MPDWIRAKAARALRCANGCASAKSETAICVALCTCRRWWPVAASHRYANFMSVCRSEEKTNSRRCWRSRANCCTPSTACSELYSPLMALVCSPSRQLKRLEVEERIYNQHEKGADGIVRACELVKRAACWCPRPATTLQKSLLLKGLSTGDALKRAPSLPRAGQALALQSFLRREKDLRSVEELEVGQFGGDAETLEATLGTSAALERQ